MKYRRLGKTGLKVSVIGMGTWQFGGEWAKTFTQQEVDQMFDVAREVGLNLIDTAECYGDHTSERLIGAAVAGDRDRWILATKFGHHFNAPFDRTPTRTANDVVQQVEASLKALRTDRIDLLQYHSWADDEFEDEQVRAVCEKLLKSGKVRHLGNSVGKAIGGSDRLSQIQLSTRYNVEVIQIVYNRLTRLPEERAFEECLRQDLGVLARVPLASGFLSGKYKPGATFSPGDVREHWPDPERDRKLAEVQTIAKKEVPQGVPMAQWALAWCLLHPAVSCVIPGCKNPDQVRDNASAADLPMVRNDHPQAWKDH